MKFEYEAAHLEQMSDDLPLLYDMYRMDGNWEATDNCEIPKFIEWIKAHNEEAKTVKRGRERVSYEDRREY